MSSFSVTRPQINTLYRSFIRYASEFEDYNFRHYFLRKYKTEFRKLKEENVKITPELWNSYQKELDVLKRQSAISKMYHFDRLVVERLDEKHHK
ncbi:unnamed protein product [Ambrosiozyma monospora]|uniref:Unnamed protein product n=1 Tax=Ambrosiozyma monospora TaxID=43982 RepID=A0ACB5THA1_AMBMO|nr:unnamed protein product [Ambrosiozyma monospora]